MSDAEPEICNCAALRQAARRVTRVYDDALAPAGLGVNQFSIVTRLSLAGPSTIQDLARLLVMDRSTLGQNLRPLERAELVAILKDPADGRNRLIALTKRGLTKLNEAAEYWRTAQDRFEEVFGEPEAAELRAMLSAIAYHPKFGERR